MRWSIALILLLTPPCWSQSRTPGAPRADPHSRPIRIGFLAHQGEDEARRAWTPTILYLERELPGIKFEMVALGFSRVGEVVARGEVDFILTNPSQYIGFELRHEAMRILTLKTLHRGVACNQLGAVVIARADRQDIVHLVDLKGKSFAAVDPISFGGWLIAKDTLIKKGIDPDRDFSRLIFEGTHDRVAKAVFEGKVDAGTVRSDELDRVDASRFRVLDPIPVRAPYPLPSTTPLYPEWPLASLAHTPDDVAQKVVIALLKLKPDDPVCRAAESAGWTIPLNYRMVHEVLRTLHAPPYQDEGKVRLVDALREYRVWILSAAALMVALLTTTGLAIHYNSEPRPENSDPAPGDAAGPRARQGGAGG